LSVTAAVLDPYPLPRRIEVGFALDPVGCVAFARCDPLLIVLMEPQER
jgi:hypothetical protein